MKKHTMCLVAAVCMVFVVPDPTAGAAGKACLISDHSGCKVMILSAEGKITWQTSYKWVLDACMRPNGNIIIAAPTSACEIVPDLKGGIGGKAVWEYAAKGEIDSCQALPDGRTLLGEAGPCRAVEIDAKGKVVKETTLTTNVKNRHMQVRCVRLTAGGTLLAAHVGEGVVREYDRTGKVLREITVPGKPSRKGNAFLAQRLANGNTLISAAGRAALYEIDPAGKVVWTVERNDVPGAELKWVAGFERLGNGNTIICNWGASYDGKAPQMFEITPDKKIVWSVINPGVKSVTTVQVLKAGQAGAAAAPVKINPPWPGRKGGNLRGFDRYDFTLDGHRCIVVAPKKPAPGKPWIWRARFFGHEPQTDAALLGKGFHVAYMEVGGLFGSPQAVARWDKLYAYLTTQHGFSKKPALEGMSRGGLIIYNWAAANPRKVSCIYGDAPVCDFKSWPGGKGKGRPSRGDWAACLRAYGLTEEQALAYKRNPIDNLKPLAEAKIPLLNVCGDSDPVVPMAENTSILAERYKALGGEITVIAKKGIGHHPHSLKDPKLIVDFILKHTK